jgi:hypothetical protein
MSTALRDAIIEEIERLPVERQPEALRAVKALGADRHVGTPGSALLPSFGAISDADARAMESAIEEECERIDANAW